MLAHRRMFGVLFYVVFLKSRHLRYGARALLDARIFRYCMARTGEQKLLFAVNIAWRVCNICRVAYVWRLRGLLEAIKLWRGATTWCASANVVSLSLFARASFRAPRGAAAKMSSRHARHLQHPGTGFLQQRCRPMS